MNNQNNGRGSAPGPGSELKKMAAVVVGGLALYAAFNYAVSGNKYEPEPGEVYYSSFMEKAKSGEVSGVLIQGSEVMGAYKDGSRFRTRIPEGDSTAVKELRQHGVSIVSRPPPQPSTSLSILTSFGPVLLLVGVWIYFMRKQMGRGPGGGGASGFGQSKAKLLTEVEGRVTFDDVAGVDEAKQDLEEIVEFLRDPQKFQKLGAKIPKGALLAGPPGTGKTLLARAVAGEAGVPFFSTSGSEFVEMYVGVGASRVRDMFAQAKEKAPCIIFIDEIDAVGKTRGSGQAGGNDERDQTLNQLLVEMDGIEGNKGVVILAATNRPDILDPALRRPGRLTRLVTVPTPDIAGREHILKVHMRNVPLTPDVNVHTIARGTPGFSGADLANLVNEAALLAARRNKRMVGMLEFEDAREKMIMGPEKKSRVISEDIRRLVAYHEAGHALLVLHEPHSEPVHKVTIIGRGGAGGYMARLPNEDKPTDKDKMKADLVVAAGGRVAEEVALGKISIGASGDIAMVTDLARAMVTQYGFSDKVGFIRHGGGQRELLGQMIGQPADVSPQTQRLIDAEVKALIDEAYAKATKTIRTHQDQLENIAQALLEFESLTGDEVKVSATGGKEAVAALRAKKELAHQRPANNNTPPYSGSVPSIPRPGQD